MEEADSGESSSLIDPDEHSEDRAQRNRDPLRVREGSLPAGAELSEAEPAMQVGPELQRVVPAIAPSASITVRNRVDAKSL